MQLTCAFEWLDESAGKARCRDCGREASISSLSARRACRRAAPVPAAAQANDCIHRGPLVREVQCASCKNSTVTVGVYHCALFGECTLHNHAARNPDLKEMHVCRGCDRRQASGVSDQAPRPMLPSLATRAKNYAGAMVRDRLGGRLRRSPELVARLFSDYCKTCPLFLPLPAGEGDGGHCSGCGCPVSPIAGEENKLSWSTENCPEKKWAIQRANLIYYILPLRNPSNVWQWHVEQLRERLNIFNGRRIVWIATKGPDTKLSLDPPEKVIEAFGRDAKSIEFVTAPNDPAHWETPAFRTMLRALYLDRPVTDLPRSREGAKEEEEEIKTLLRAFAPSRDPSPSEATFYFHAKGVRRANQSAIRPWCEAIYHHNLDRWPEVRQILSVYPCCGIARQPTNPITGPNGGQGWHFAGTGFWFNHAALFGRGLTQFSAGASGASGAENGSDPFAWDKIQNHSHAVEAYLSTQFPYESAYCLAHDNAGGTFGGVYAPRTWSNPRGNSAPPAIARAGTFRDPPEDLTLLVLGHDRHRLRWVTELPWIQKVFLPDLDPRNDLAESRVFPHLSSLIPHPSSAYLGLCTQSWDRKYGHYALKLAELDQLDRRRDLVWAAAVTPPDWVEMSERDHPGMGAVLRELAEQLGLSDDDLRRPSLWSNNLIAHRDVVLDLAEWHRKLLTWCLARWGWRPPYQSEHYSSPHGGGGATRHFSFLAERFTVLYFCARRNLEVRQIPKSAEEGKKITGKKMPARNLFASNFFAHSEASTKLASRVITAADDGFFLPLQIFVESLQAAHTCDVTVFDLGLSAEQLTWLAGRGVTVERCLLDRVSPAIEKQWLKAAALAHASREARPLLWLDADIIVAGSLAPLEEISLDQKPFVTPCYAAALYWGAGRERDCLANHDLLYTRHPVPARLERDWPNSGVFGCHPVRDRELVDTWRWISEQAIADPTLRHLLRYWDQGALQWSLEKLGLLDLMTRDKRFNDCDLQGEKTIDELCAAIAGKVARDDARIIHFAGTKKPYRGL